LDEIGKLPEDQAKKIFRQMVKIVKYLHLQKICHRDLKAENFLFSGRDNDHIVLIDFGLSYQWQDNMEEELIMYGANKILGTAYYIAPEVLQKKYDERCDIWSLGALLHIIATATAPFMGDGDMEIIENVKKNNYNRSSLFFI
jgi:calcium-dependent protein kinase